MKKFVFEFNEITKGIMVVYAENEDEAIDKAHSYDGDYLINKSQEEVGKLIEVTDVE